MLIGIAALVAPFWFFAGLVPVPEYRTGTIPDLTPALVAGITLYGGVLAVVFFNGHMAGRRARGGEISPVRIQHRMFGMCWAVEVLGMGVLVHPTDKERVRLMLRPWIVEAALARLGSTRLSIEEQQTVLKSTRTPIKVHWPNGGLLEPSAPILRSAFDSTGP